VSCRTSLHLARLADAHLVGEQQPAAVLDPELDTLLLEIAQIAPGFLWYA
jgi:hypothetical protein